MNPGAQAGQDLLVKIVSGAREGIGIIDAQQHDFPLIYVNEGFERLTGYSCGEVMAGNYRILQGADPDQPETAVMLAAIANGKDRVATLRNSRKDGSVFWNELSIHPVHDAQGKLTHFIGFMKDVADFAHAGQRTEVPDPAGRLTGIIDRIRFDERFADMLNAAQRIRGEISVLMIGLDHFDLFKERYGRVAGEECLLKVGGRIAKSFIRSSDCVARYGSDGFAVVAFSAGIEILRDHAKRLCERVRSLNIPHGGSPHGVVTISIGGVQRLPNRDTTQALLVGLATGELQAAGNRGHDSVQIID